MLWLRNWRRRVFDPAVTAAGLGELTPHELRHTAASLAVAAGANVKAVQRMLGHASAAMTLDVYSGLLDDDLDAVAYRLDAAARTARERSRSQQPAGRPRDHHAALDRRFEDQDPADVRDATPLRAIRDAVTGRAANERRVAETVATAREAGVSWSAIGAMLGSSGEAARKRYSGHHAKTGYRDHVTHSGSRPGRALPPVTPVVRAPPGGGSRRAVGGPRAARNGSA